MAKFKEFIQTEIAKTLSSDGTDPNPTQTLKSAQKLSSNLFADPSVSNDVGKISAMSPGIRRRTAISDMASQAINKANVPVGQTRANPMDVTKFMTQQFDKIGKPGSTTDNKFMKRMKK